MSTGDPSGDQPQRPVLRVVNGSPTAEELAALTAVVAAASSAPSDSQDDGRNRRGRWADPAAMHRRPLIAGANGWRAGAQ